MRSSLGHECLPKICAHSRGSLRGGLVTCRHGRAAQCVNAIRQQPQHVEQHDRNTVNMDSLRGSSVTIGTMQRKFAWPLRKDDTLKSGSVNNYYKRETINKRRLTWQELNYDDPNSIFSIQFLINSILLFTLSYHFVLFRL